MQHQSLWRRTLRKRLNCLLRIRMTYTYKSRCEKSFTNTVSLDPDTYDLLLQAFSRLYIVQSGPYGRPRRFASKNNALACVLHLYTAAVTLETLYELFKRSKRYQKPR
ncbi:putative DDE Tnp4 domain-containing protein [Phytophthora infestans]|uniref:Putative DDE Tnp4 domain-containing protein n=1 Tax=Phytophthora infestans TaxID=4787 RepID=A0A833TBB4_PHYIN|nr:putative DDE Tnp4 domain-containing protein [Phytophthora infestans]